MKNINFKGFEVIFIRETHKIFACGVPFLDNVDIKHFLVWFWSILTFLSLFSLINWEHLTLMKLETPLQNFMFRVIEFNMPRRVQINRTMGNSLLPICKKCYVMYMKIISQKCKRIYSLGFLVQSTLHLYLRVFVYVPQYFFLMQRKFSTVIGAIRWQHLSCYSSWYG